MIDSHCHLDFADFDTDRNDILMRCQALSISEIIIPGTQANRWHDLIQLCQDHDSLHCGLGMHPYFIETMQSSDLASLHKLLGQHHESVVALGEIGLDYVTPPADSHRVQRQVFAQQIDLANQFGLPVIIHHRRSHNDIIKQLKQTPALKGGVIHAFSGSYQIAKTYLDLGMKLGVGGTITYSRAQKTRETLNKVPDDCLLLETDAPDMPISGKQGQRNSPEYLPEILSMLAQLRHVSCEQLERITDANARALFQI